MRQIRNCNVAVVGGAGFLGSHLVDHLIEDRNCNVLVIDNLVAGRREFVHRDATFAHYDITGSESTLRNMLRGYQYVLNYAAYPYIPVSFARPIHVCDVNFMGAMKVINAAQEADVEAILQVSSAEIYGDGHAIEGDNFKVKYKERIAEDCPVNPHSSYGVAKAAVDNWVQCRWREARTPCIALRQFNCLGERETHPYIVPEIISQLSKFMPDETHVRNHEPLVKLGNNTFRDFLYAGDAVRIAVELLERGQFGEVYNLGSETGIKMYDLAKLICKLMGFNDVQVIVDPKRVRPWEIWHLMADNSKIKSVCKQKENLQPDQVGCLMPLETALKRTIDWYNSNGRRWAWE